VHSLSVANVYRINPAASWSAAIKCIVSLAGPSELLYGESGEEFVRIMASFAVRAGCHDGVTLGPFSGSSPGGREGRVRHSIGNNG
jgi:hypothetical protein